MRKKCTFEEIRGGWMMIETRGTRKLFTVTSSTTRGDHSCETMSQGTLFKYWHTPAKRGLLKFSRGRRSFIGAKKEAFSLRLSLFLVPARYRALVAQT